jgi:multiple sugar transport system ATP-binding protein
MNLLEAVVRDGRVLVGGLDVPVPPAAAARVRDRVTIGVRPESFRIVPAGQGLPMEAVMVEELGADSFVHGVSEIDGSRQQLIVRAGARGDVQRGDVVHVVPDPAGVHAFDTESGVRLGD